MPCSRVKRRAPSLPSMPRTPKPPGTHDGVDVAEQPLGTLGRHAVVGR